jgi:hypothetical protein
LNQIDDFTNDISHSANCVCFVSNIAIGSIGRSGVSSEYDQVQM